MMNIYISSPYYIRAMKEPNPFIFFDAQKEVFKLMEQGPWKEFVKSEYFKEYQVLQGNNYNHNHNQLR